MPDFLAGSLPWIVFFSIILVMICVDLGVFHKKSHEVTMKESFGWTVVWICLALCFNAYIYYIKGQQASIEFFTGYLVEKSLSLDNVFVFLTIFHAFKVPLKYQHRVLMWGIIGAIIMRAIFISLGAILVAEFSWIFYVFGAFLIYTAYTFMQEETEEKNFSKHPVVLFLQRHLPMSKKKDGDKFFTMEKGKHVATPLFLVLLSIEFSDVIFAIDSIPAIFAITQDTYIVFTSNIFAILGLRALYFVIANMAVKFVYLSYGLAVILGYIGLKLILHHFVKIPSFISLSVIGFALSLSIIASLIFERRQQK